MNARLIAIVTALSLVQGASRARAQCDDWQPALLDNGTAPNGANGSVEAMTVWDPDGSGPQPPLLVVGGQFTSIEGLSASYIAARNPATGDWQPLGSGTDKVVQTLTVYNNELIAGGSFASPGARIARWNGSLWQPLGGGLENTLNFGFVRSLTQYNGDLIAGGNFFVTVDGQLIAMIARWNGSSWQPLGNALNATVLALTVYGDLIAGGEFGLPTQHIAGWDGSLWQPLGGGLNSAVNCLTAYGGELIAGGSFSMAGGNSANNIARWDGTSWQPLGSGTDATVRCLTVYNGELIVGGEFVTAGGPPANHIARWNGSFWQPLGSGTDGAVSSLTVYDGQLIVGGEFTSAGGRPANHIARWNGFEWGPFGGGTVTSVLAMTEYVGRVVAGGDFHQSAGAGPTAHNIVAWDGLELSTLGAGMDGRVFALKAFKYPGISGDYELIAGGSFGRAGDVPAYNIARWDQDPISVFPPPVWQAMGTGFVGDVYAIERFNNATYAGGEFIQPVTRIARWNEATDTWEPLGSGMNGAVFALKAYNGYLYAGGVFTTADGIPTGGLARWNGSAWSQVGGNFIGTIYALEVHNGQLVIGGLFPGINNSPNLAQYDGSTYSTFGTGGTDLTVRALQSGGPRLYVGGDFFTAGGVTAKRIAYWDGAWHELRGGADNTVAALMWYHDEVHLGGTFQNVRNGAIPSPGWGKYRETGVPWIVTPPASQSVQSGADVAFSVQGASGYGGLTYQWYRKGAPLVNGATGTGSTVSGATAHVLVVSNVSPADAVYYHVVLSNSCGSVTSWDALLTVDGVTAVEASGSPGATVFEALGPNPSHGASRLAFSLARDAQVRVQVHDVAGRRVRLIEVGRLPAGRHQATWDARASNGQQVRAGLYFVGLEVDGRRLGVKRVTMLP